MPLCCRICFKRRPDSFTIYTYKKKKYLPHVINNISGVNISKENEPQAQICPQCAASVLVAENIILQCQESEQYFQYQRLQLNRLQRQTLKAHSNVHEKSEQQINASQCDTELNTATEHNTVASIDSKKEEDITISPQSEPSAKRIKDADAAIVVIFNCDECNFSTKTGKRIIEHRQTVHGVYDPNIYACTHCTQRFSWKPTLYRHIELVHKIIPEDKRYLCNECGQAYMREIHLLEHIKQRHGPRNFKCPDPLCEQSFTRTFTLRRHFITTHTEQTSTRYHCIDCNKYFKVYDQWKYHNEIVHKNGTVYCPHCGYPFRFKDKLDEHLMKDVCKRSVVPCAYCQRRFTTKNGLREHMRNIHSNG
ncbi:zinc finger protein 497-like [Eurosta solidaginis]|uniref:zinc finger protein 497-like n=1 Tax=Eurosta solidaginis TaxID=178769 RepID=UPI003530DBBC